MALKGKPVAIGNTSTTIYTCPSGTEAAVHGLIFSNNTAGALAVDVIVYNQADNTTTTVATDLNVPGNSYITWTKPVNMNAGDSVRAVSSAASGLVCLFSVYEGSAAPVATGFTGRGVWSSGSTYAVNDIVSVTGSGTYLALQASTNQDPTTATSFWMFLEGISASALPVQTSQAGKFLTTDGTDASWAEVDVAGGATITSPMSSNVTLTAASKRVQVFYPDASRDVTLPAASTLTLGESFVIANKASFTITVRNNAGALLTVVGPSKAAKFLLVDISTSDWEALAVDLASQMIPLANLPLGTATAYSFNYYYAPKIEKIATNKYQVFTGILNSSIQWGVSSEIFTIDNDNVFTLNRAQHVEFSFGPASTVGYNHIAMLDTGIAFAGGYDSDTTANASLIEMSESVNIVRRHSFTQAIADGYSPTVARVSTRKGIVFFSARNNSTNALNYIARVADYSSSLTSPTLGTAVNFSSGGTHNPALGDAEQLENDKGILMYNSRNGTTGDTYEKRVVVWTVSGTTPTFHTPLTLTTSRVSNAAVRLRVLSSTKAVAVWVEGNSVVGVVLSISSNTISAGAKFTITPAVFNVSNTCVIRGENDNVFYVTAQNSSDNGCYYVSRFTLSGTSYVANSAFSKLSPAIAGINSISSHGVVDPDKNNSLIVYHGSNSTSIGAIAAVTSI